MALLKERLAGRFVLLAVIVTCAGLVYEVRHARALGVPTLTPLAYSGSLLTFGTPDNSTHAMQLALFVAGANDGGLGSAACTTSLSVTCVNGQFTIPLSSSCLSVIQQNPNVQAEVQVDSVPMGMVNLSAVPYAIEAGTAATVSALDITGIVPVISGGTGSSTQNFVDLSSTQTVGGAKTLSSALTVNGAVHSTSGGIEYPDGTVQTSAARHHAVAYSASNFIPPTSMSAASSSANNVPGLVTTITTQGGDLEINAQIFMMWQTVGARGAFSASIDGQWLGAYLGWGTTWGNWFDGIIGMYAGANWDTRTYHRIVPGVPAGTHTIQFLAWNETSNGWYINCCSMVSELDVEELTP